jgi:molecular chaperone DnaJ
VPSTSPINIDGIFGDLLGALGIKVGQAPPLQKEVKLTFEEAAFGCTKELTYERVEACGDCSGSGAAEGSKPETCTVCRGRGRVRVQQGVLPIAIERPCTPCKGSGRIVKDPCKACRGVGLLAKERTIEITIPAGIENGATRLVERAGNYPRPEKQAGDLELVIRVAPHEFFRRVGDDVVCSLLISSRKPSSGSGSSPTLDRRGKLRIPGDTSPARCFASRQGHPEAHDDGRRSAGRGDRRPRQVDDEQRLIRDRRPSATRFSPSLRADPPRAEEPPAEPRAHS